MSRITRAILFLLVTLLFALPVAPAASQRNGGLSGIDPAWLRAERQRLQATMPSGQQLAGGFAGTGRVRVVMELADAPVAQTYAAALAREQSTFAAAAAGRARLARIEQAQQELLRAAESLDARLIYRVQRVYNGIALEIDAERLDELRQLPGVIRISPLIARQRANASSVPFIGAPAVWAGPPGATGQGVRIGIIDTGIDYTHAGLGGSGLTNDFQSNDGRVITDAATINNFGTGRKVAGGFDFAGDKYDATCPPAGEAAGQCSRTPQPDPDPFDNCDGHGSHVAGTAAGNGVLTGGAAYTGPYNNAFNFNQFRIGPGVAPQAALYAIRVFGCSGSSEIVDLGIEWAVDPNGDGNLNDHLDVINLSLGASFGGPNDPTAIASDNAALAGVIVVAAAGNSGDTYYIADSPGVADRALSVAASVAGNNASLYDTLPTFSSRGPRRLDSFLKPDLTAPGNTIVSVDMGSGNGPRTLSGTSMATPHVAGLLALLRQLHPSWTVEELKALAINTATQDLFTGANRSGLPYGPGRVGAGRIVADQAGRGSLIAYNAADPGLVNLSFGLVPVLTETLTLSKPVRVVNRGTVAQNLAASYLPRVQTSGLSVAITPTNLLLPAGGSALVTVTLTADPNAMERDGRDPTVATRIGDLDRHWLGESAGYLELRAASGPPVRVPVHAAPRRISAMAAAQERIDVGEQSAINTSITLQGADIDLPTLSSLVGAFELHEISPRSTSGYTSAADLAYLGVTSEGMLDDNTLIFAIATHGERTTPQICDTEFRVYIDTNGSGIGENGEDAEFVLRNVSAADAASRSCQASDVFVSALYRPDGSLIAFEYANLVSAQIDTAIYNSDVIALPVAVNRLELSEGRTRINYRVVSEIAGSGVIDRSQTYSFDPAAPGLDFVESLVSALHADRNGEQINFRFTRQNYIANDTQGLLLLHFHNATGNRAEVIPIDYVDYPRYLPLIFTPLPDATPQAE